MQSIRQTENLLAERYASNLLKTPMHLANGSEAIPCGVLPFFTKPRLFGTYRNHHWFIEVTRDPRSLMLELLGKQNSPNQGRAGSMHLSYPEKGMILTSAVVSSTIPVAVGDAWAGMQDKSNQQTIAFFGDGATEEGVFFESLNFSALKKIPILFVCEDNDLAIHSKKNQREAFKLKKLAEACDIPYFFAEAFKIENVVELMPKVKEALAKGPVIFHLEYFRMLSHVGIESDFDQGYRIVPVNDHELDPIQNCERSLLAIGTKIEVLQEITEKIKDELNTIYDSCLKEADANPTRASDFVFGAKL